MISDPHLQELDAKEKQIQLWKLKRLVTSLEAAKGNGTSMITLLLSPKEQIPRVAKMLSDE